MPATIDFTSNGRAVQGELYTPVAGAAAPGFIAVAYGTDGMSETWGTQIRRYADALSHLGFVVMIPDYFACTGTIAGQDAFAEMTANGDTWQQALADAVTYAKANLGVDGTRVGLLGFSLGGLLCLRQRRSANVLVEFFAPIDGLVAGAAGLTSHAQIHHGLADVVVSFSGNADKINQMLTTEGVAVELFSYPGGTHGFIGSDANNTSAISDSLDRTLDCFGKYL